MRAGPGLVRGRRGLRLPPRPMAGIVRGCASNRRPARQWPANFGGRRQWPHGGRTDGRTEAVAAYRREKAVCRDKRLMWPVILSTCRREAVDQRPQTLRLPFFSACRPPPLSSGAMLHKEHGARTTPLGAVIPLPLAPRRGHRPARKTSEQQPVCPPRATEDASEHTRINSFSI